MADEPKKDPAPAAEPAVETVSKADHEKALKERDDKLVSLKQQLDEKDLKLLDPDYLKWESDKTKAAQPKFETSKDPVVAELQKTNKALQDQLSNQSQLLSSLMAEAELSRTVQAYPDFNDYKEDVAAILRVSDSALTYEQAYKLAKAERKDKEDSEKKLKDAKNKAPVGGEKPSGSKPASSMEQKDFKSVEEANQATIAALRDKWPDLGNEL